MDRSATWQCQTGQGLGFRHNNRHYNEAPHITLWLRQLLTGALTRTQHARNMCGNHDSQAAPHLNLRSRQLLADNLHHQLAGEAISWVLMQQGAGSGGNRRQVESDLGVIRVDVRHVTCHLRGGTRRFHVSSTCYGTSNGSTSRDSAHSGPVESKSIQANRDCSWFVQMARVARACYFHCTERGGDDGWALAIIKSSGDFGTGWLQSFDREISREHQKKGDVEGRALTIITEFEPIMMPFGSITLSVVNEHQQLNWTYIIS